MKKELSITRAAGWGSLNCDRLSSFASLGQRKANLKGQISATLIFLGLVLPLVSAAISIENPLEADTFGELIENIATFIFNIALAIVPLMIVIAGIYFVTAAGNPAQVEKAKGIILYTVIGFIIILLARGFIEFLRQVL